MDVRRSQVEVKHHKQHDLCKTRAPYRQGKKLTAVKVYTVSSESQHLFVYGVPMIKLRSELKSLFSRYGQVKSISIVADIETEIFTECYHVQFIRIQSARIAKRLLDNKSFYGGILHICYAPECENINETRAKLLQRSTDVLKRLKSDDTDYVNNKRSYTHVNENEKTFSNDPMISWIQDPPISVAMISKPVQDAKENSCTNEQKPNKIMKRDLIPVQLLKSKDVTIKPIAVEKKIIFYNK